MTECIPNNDIAPSAAEIDWRDRPTAHPTDALAICDPYAAIAESYAQTVSYRELAQTALAEISRLTASHARLQAALRAALDELRAVHGSRAA